MNTTETTVPRYLRWSKSPIVFDRRDHPDNIPHLEVYPLVVESVIGSKRVTKVLMDGGTDLNIMYIENFDELGIARSTL